MKTSPSSRTAFLQALMIFLMFLSVTRATGGAARFPEATSSSRQMYQRHNINYQVVHGRNFGQHSWNNAISGNSMQTPPGIVCFQLQRIRRCQPFPTPPPPPPPPPSDYEIDPRYGVEKRLVPSGPNPLHN